MESRRNIPKTIETILRAAVKDLRATGVPTGFASPGRANVERAVNAIDSIEAAASELETLAAEGPSGDSADTAALDFLDAVIADAMGRRFALTDGSDVMYIETYGALDVRTILAAEMAKAGERARVANAS